jgi:hypothetical protein
MHVIVFDRVDTFNSGVTDGLAAAPVSFDTTQATSNSPYQNCLFGKDRGAGSCLGASLGSASASSYRNRGINIVYSYQMRKSALNFGAGYSRRTYFDEPGVIGSLNGVVDQSIFAQAGYTRQLARDSGVNFALSGNLFKNGQVGVPDVRSVALDGGYFRIFGKGVRAQATFGVEASKTDGVAADISARGQFDVRYQF